VIARSLACLLACATLIAGCADDRTATTPPPSTVPEQLPTAAQLGRIRSTTSAPFFWLGRAYRAQRLTHAALTAQEPPDSIFQYGTPTCEAGAGCSYDLGVATLRERDPDTTQRCWRRLGAAIALGCDRAAVLQVYTGSVEVFLSSQALNPARVARALRLKGPGTAAGTRLRGLTTPRPFTCQEARRFPADFRARVPPELAARACGDVGRR